MSSRAATALLTAGVLALLGCRAEEPQLPQGTTVAGDAAPFRDFLRQLQAFAGTPLARWAEGAGEKLEGCDQFLARRRPLDAEGWPTAAACRDRGSLPPFIERLRGTSDLAFVTPEWDGARVTGRCSFAADGAVRLEADLPPPPEDHPLSPFLPAADRTGPALLNDTGTLIHGRFVADRGLQVARWVSPGGAADRLFRLRSQLFAGLVLNGVWELAVYLPAEGQRLPPVALAVEFRNRGAATAAMEEFLRDLEQTWPLHATPYRVGGLAGACVSDLRILPELAPCYVVTERALVVGWNPAVIERALAGGDPEVLSGQSSLHIELDRFPEAERRLTEALTGEPPEWPQRYPWRRLVATGRKEGGRYRFGVELIPAEPPTASSGAPSTVDDPQHHEPPQQQVDE